MRWTYLDLLVAVREIRGGRQQTDDRARQHQNACAHRPVEGSHARRRVHACVAALRAGQALELGRLVVFGRLALFGFWCMCECVPCVCVWWG